MIRDTNKCPVQIRNDKRCDFVFPSTHYTDREPHLRTHTLRDVARSLFCILGDVSWYQTMAKEASQALTLERNKELIEEAKEKLKKQKEEKSK